MRFLKQGMLFFLTVDTDAQCFAVSVLSPRTLLQIAHEAHTARHVLRCSAFNTFKQK